MDEVKGLSDAIEAKAWYPLVAYAVALLIRIFRTWKPRLFEEKDGKPAILPARIQWLPALLLAAATACVDGFASGYSWKITLILVIYAAATGGVGAVGVHRVGKELAGKTLVLLCLLPALTACAEAKPYLRTADDVASALCAAFFSEKQGISLEQAAETFCRDKRQIQPWIDQVLAMKKNGISASAEAGCE